MPHRSADETFQRYLKQNFGTASDNYRTVVPALFRRLKTAEPESDITASYRLWQESVDVNIAKAESAAMDTVAELGIDTGDGPRAEEFLYCLQSYYALVLQLDRATSMARLVEGNGVNHAAYGELRSEYGNLLAQPEDRLFHGWLAGADFDGDPLGGLVASMSNAPRRAVGEDGFKRLYQDLIGAPFRKAMGEFYTREWIAELLLDEIAYDGTSVLDPACGSGAFLVKAARRIVRDGETPGDIDRIHGFDLNPVAVMAAKSNLLGVLSGHFDDGALTRSELADVDMPVFWTNSIVWTEPDLSGNNVTLPSPYGELAFPRDPDGAVAKIRDDMADWVDGKPFEGIVDGDWIDGIARSFAAPIVCPPVDYVVGNPPWVSPDRMPKEYRDRVTDLLEESGFLEPFQPDYLTNRFPNSQFVAALPFFEVAMNRYLKKGGTCAYLVTSSLLKSMNGGGFREQMQNWRVTRILDFTPYTDIHRNADSWAVAPVIHNSAADGGSTLFEFFLPTNGGRPRHPGSCRTVDAPDVTLHVCAWEVDLADVPFLPDDPRSPWFTAPPEVIESYRTMSEGVPHLGEHCRLTRGLTTGRNAVYLLDDVERAGDGFVEARSSASDGRIALESELVYPFVEGKHLRAWGFGHTHLLLPYDVPAWEPIPEDALRERGPNAASYLDDNRAVLKSRRTHTITSQLDGGSPFYVVETRDVLGERPVVGVREVAPYPEAAVVPPTIDDDVLGVRKSVVAHTLNFVVPGSDDEAYYLAGLLNSWPLRTLMYDLAQPKGGRPGKRYDMYLISSLPVPEFDPDDGVHRAIADLGREAHELVREGDDASGVERELNEIVCEELYGMATDAYDSLRRHYDRLAHTPD